MHYTVSPNDGDGVLYVKSLDDDKVHEIPRGANPAFSDDGRWIGYFIAPPAAEGRGRGRGGRGSTPGATGAPPAPARPFEVIDLFAGTRTSFASVGNFASSPDGEWLLIRPQTADAPLPRLARLAVAVVVEPSATKVAQRTTAHRQPTC